jgi:hypothetical protein
MRVHWVNSPCLSPVCDTDCSGQTRVLRRIQFENQRIQPNDRFSSGFSAGMIYFQHIDFSLPTDLDEAQSH